jgi:nicotinate-nucleotide adenylyltransferase
VSGVGLLGGTFNPPHVGHLALAQAALGKLDLDRLLVVPTGQTPGKEVDVDAETRLRLAEAAFAGMPRVEVSRLELDRAQPSYSYETVCWATEQWGEIVFVVGADRFADFLTWKRPNEVLRCARLGVATRPGWPRDRLEDVLRAVERPERVTFFDFEPVPVSSTDVRARVARDEPIDDLVPPAVARLIAELGLYRNG